MTEDNGTPGRILDVAERLVQSRGFNGFSYADVANELGVTKASLHYHYSGKAELGEALISRYSARFFSALDRIDHSGLDAPSRLEAYADLYANVLREQRMCLCGMLAADYSTLPDRMRSAVVDFFDRNQSWLVATLEAGRAEGTIRADGDAADQAQLILGALEGGMLVARPYADPDRFSHATRRLLATLTAPATARLQPGPASGQGA